MAAPQVHHLFHAPIADHSFSADRETLAIARDSTIELYGQAGNAFKLKDELKGHDKTVTSVDIAPKSGRIVSCSQDRNALVWEPSPTGYKPTLVLLRISRAATFVRWSPSETKFAVGSGDRVIAVCYFEEENDWWVSKHLKKPIRSTITSVAWHPNSVLLAAGSTDAHARVLSSFIKGVDARPEPTAWGERLPFNTVCGEYLNNSAGWVHSVSFSPSGNALAFAAHDSSITVVYPSAPEQPPRAVVTITTQLLPFMSLLWSSEDEIIAAGYDCEAFRFKGGEEGWSLAGTLESKGRPGLSDAREESALNMFRQMDLKGKAKDDTQLKTVHQNTVTTLRPYESSGDNLTKFSCFFAPVVRVPISNALVIEQEEPKVSEEMGDSPVDITRTTRRSTSTITVSGASPPWIEDASGFNSRQSQPRLRSDESAAQTGGLDSISSLQSMRNLAYEARVHAVHEICLPATRKYLEERQANLRLRTAPISLRCPGMRRHAPRASSRFTPYAVPAQSFGNPSSTASELLDSATETSTGSLLANVSRICDGFWAQAQRDRLHVPDTEKAAVQSMRHLLHWAETIVNTPMSWMTTHWVFTHGKNLCAWLGDSDGRLKLDRLGLSLQTCWTGWHF
ncbi:Actin-related protein 2/3 complex subunit 1 [Colletotrichum tanaceti]|uniref:Arp2/3 complex 41 kDa subunit n=1 Tax=Colletotrichum tanaceti TaxID=1306861 RepID=A0A4U6XW35_9PEZI|nr:Actin-related protein 2/3 complex subunit 1 [Colletotrichum tanaceti]KAJ0168490.1 Actin-related protein 2/3 complex subunit 1 [Colletotrichum tanaceti]TKW60202.1 Actin-related protein 2/3 complex subunit 1 [Colletotrichum tanaceti]